MTPPNSERRRLIETIFQEVLDTPSKKRPALLDARCEDDQELRREVETLIHHYEEAQKSSILNAEELLEGARLDEDTGSGQQAFEPEEGDIEGKRIGPYRLIREIGRGGMGRVFLAEREDLPRRVAVKLTREPLASPDRTRRFLFEQWVLSGLEHPGIAQLFDAGVTEDGTPYFAMEYLEGEPLDVYCDGKRLSVEERLELLLRVLEAVQHSHAHLVIHRDLKPSNILVTRNGDPKLLDFGIAKLLTEEGDAGLTRSGMLAISPAYASPEQFGGEPVTTATDVYQLGAILYELLSGAPAFDLEGKSLTEAGRIVSEEEPPPPSSRVTEAAAAARGTSRDRLRRKLKGDLDHVVSRAMQKNPGRRYDSVFALASDIRRYLAHLPLEARAATPFERARKFTKRHKLGVGIAAGLLLYAATATYGLVGISQERDRARREAATANRVTEFLMGVFASADPSDTSAVTTPLQLVDRGVAGVEEDLAEEPAVQASMQLVLGRVYHYLGRDSQAGELLHKSLDTRRRLFGDNSVEAADAKHYLAQVAWSVGDLTAADSLVRESLPIRREAHGETSDAYWESLSDLGTIQHVLGDLEGAEQTFLELLEAVRKEHPEGYEWMGPWLNNLANVYMDQGKRDKAEEMMREALASDRKVLPEPHPNIALRLSNLASMAAWDGRHEESLNLAREALADYEDLYPGPHPDIPYALVSIGNAQRNLGNLAAADSAHRAALEMREALFPPGHIGLITAYRYYGEHLMATDRYREAEPYLEKWRDLAAEIHGEEHYSYGLAVWTLGVAKDNLERPDLAEPLLRRGLAIHTEVLGETHPRVQDERKVLADFLRAAGRAEEALVLETETPPATQ